MRIHHFNQTLLFDEKSLLAVFSVEVVARGEKNVVIFFISNQIPIYFERTYIRKNVSPSSHSSAIHIQTVKQLGAVLLIAYVT